MNRSYIFTRLFTTFQCHNKFQIADRLLNCAPPLNNFINDYRSKISETICNTRYRTLQLYANNYNCPLITNYAYPTGKQYRMNHVINLVNTFKMFKLRYQNDPDFSKKSFERGTKQVSN